MLTIVEDSGWNGKSFAVTVVCSADYIPVRKTVGGMERVLL